MEQFCVSKFEFKNSKIKKWEMLILLMIDSNNEKDSLFLLKNFYKNLAYTKLYNDFIFYIFKFCNFKKGKMSPPKSFKMSQTETSLKGHSKGQNSKRGCPKIGPQETKNPAR